MYCMDLVYICIQNCSLFVVFILCLKEKSIGGRNFCLLQMFILKVYNKNLRIYF